MRRLVLFFGSRVFLPLAGLPHGDVGKRQGVARLDVGLGAGDDDVAHGKALGAQDVGLGTVDVVEQRDAGGAVGVVLDRGDLGRHAVLVALEVDDAVLTLVAAALVAGGHAALVVAAGLLGQGLEQRLLGLVGRDLGEVRDRLPAPACAGGLEVLDSHLCFPFRFSVGHPAQGMRPGGVASCGRTVVASAR